MGDPGANSPESPNANGDRPAVRRVDVIVGAVSGRAEDRELDSNKSTRVIARLTGRDWRANADVRMASLTIPKIDGSLYIRVRGTSTDEQEPQMDPAGENPWTDLWFYSNPIFVDVTDSR